MDNCPTTLSFLSTARGSTTVLKYFHLCHRRRSKCVRISVHLGSHNFPRKRVFPLVQWANTKRRKVSLVKICTSIQIPGIQLVSSLDSLRHHQETLDICKRLMMRHSLQPRSPQLACRTELPKSMGMHWTNVSRTQATLHYVPHVANLEANVQTADPVDQWHHYTLRVRYKPPMATTLLTRILHHPCQPLLVSGGPPPMNHPLDSSPGGVPR